LIGPSWQAKLALEGNAKDPSLVPLKYKRSSTIGSAIHAWAEKAYHDKEGIISELYMEVPFRGYTITGTFDILFWMEDEWYMADIKTGYGTRTGLDQIDKWTKQMSIYRWMLKQRKDTKDMDVSDEAFILFISQSNNFQDVSPIDLMSYEEVEEYIAERIRKAEEVLEEDCHKGIRYNPCCYCDYICEYRGHCR
jgi:hypothetical protein